MNNSTGERIADALEMIAEALTSPADEGGESVVPVKEDD